MDAGQPMLPATNNFATRILPVGEKYWFWQLHCTFHIEDFPYDFPSP